MSRKDRLPKFSPAGTKEARRPCRAIRETACELLKLLVGDTGIEPVTSSVSRKRAPAAPIALCLLH